MIAGSNKSMERKEGKFEMQSGYGDQNSEEKKRLKIISSKQNAL